MTNLINPGPRLLKKKMGGLTTRYIPRSNERPLAGLGETKIITASEKKQTSNLSAASRYRGLASGIAKGTLVAYRVKQPKPSYEEISHRDLKVIG
ncbi:uncharacterized protein H6S33_003248 [Morchella sextelata]|uniref:uncharacterized protein n=1 Tax=Morchella sextelata TaxID=1174677 RepID=UPI001D04E2A8|nr:uncharacterized protein H6S33_003248 [Morchella sextelata]KAH0607260.1 hypothetical protein H6S33_003248 [Morchella sextelata]